MINKESLVKDITGENRNLESVFERFGLKNNINWSIKDACEGKSVNPDFLVEILKAFDDKDLFPKKELSQFPLDYIIAYLKNTHNYYLNKCLPEIEQSIEYFKRHFEQTHRIQSLLIKLFLNYRKKLTEHIRNEEEKLFPYIEGLIKNKIPVSLKDYSIDKFILQHKDVEEELRVIKALIEEHSKNAVNEMPFTIFINQLNIFEKDLCRHAMVEDEVLIPMALDHERKLKNKNL